ncbi:MAG TPA: hypothetical protein ENK58_05005 [Desulfobacterales bacterium]|nr:hypothetical protein [Desulfobacterales bacterium]
MQDEKLIDAVIAEILDDPEALSEVAEDIADELADLLEDDPTFKKKLYSAAMEEGDFKKRIIKNMVKEMTD